MSLILRRFAAAWLLERVSSGEQRRRWCEEENYRCIYTGEQAKLKVFSRLIDWKWVKVGTTTRKCWHVAGQLQLNSSWLLVFLPKKLNEYFFLPTCFPDTKQESALFFMYVLCKCYKKGKILQSNKLESSDFWENKSLRISLYQSVQVTH